jgi:uncharacterized protein (DUF2267 family)
VFTTVREAVPGEEFADLVAQLPREFYEMLEPVGLRAGGRRGDGR